MSKLQTAPLAFAVLGLLFSPACSKTTEREPAMRPASGTNTVPVARPKTGEGINLISEARCDREVRCGGVGQGETWETRDRCIADLNHEGHADLDDETCPGGLDQRNVDRCLSEINAERCGAPLDTLERLVACRAASLCKN